MGGRSIGLRLAHSNSIIREDHLNWAKRRKEEGKKKKMGKKRARDEDQHENQTAARDHDAKRRKKGFAVGPANLPDGTYRRKGQTNFRSHFLSPSCE